jgi:hypothetical protein
MQKQTIVLMMALMAVPPLAIATGDQYSVTTNLSGTFNNPQENGCIHVSLFFNRVDCSYSHRRLQLNGRPIPWVGYAGQLRGEDRAPSQAGKGSQSSVTLPIPTGTTLSATKLRWNLSFTGRAPQAYKHKLRLRA